jgi:arabinose-5-phosphate isomerase
MNLEDQQKHEWLDIARTALKNESDAILQVAVRLDEAFIQAVALILHHPGKVIVTGMGKSGHIARKLVGTLCSTGTQAVFLHAAEAIHGDIGIFTPGDPAIIICKSGSTSEIIRLIPFLKQMNSPIIAIAGNLESPLARQADIVLDGRVDREADPLGLAPTSSSMAALAIGDALASTLIYARKFTAEDFALKHPGGQLGRNLILKVAEVMHRGSAVAWVREDESFRAAVIAMTQHPLGAACVINEKRKLLGIVTDGDIRRALHEHEDIRPLTVKDVMTKNPITIDTEAPLREALQVMEDRPSQIAVLPVQDHCTGQCLGLIRLHDIYQPNLS